MKCIAKLKETKNIEVILQVKGNQKKLLEKCVDLTQTYIPEATTIDKGKRERNRIETRSVSLFYKNKYDLGDVWNDHIHSIIRVKRRTKCLNTKTKQWDVRKETAYYISTTNVLSVKEFAKANSFSLEDREL